MAASPASTAVVEVRDLGGLLHKVLDHLALRGSSSSSVSIKDLEACHGITHDQLFDIVLPKHKDLFDLTFYPHPTTGVMELYTVSLRQTLPGMQAGMHKGEEAAAKTISAPEEPPPANDLSSALAIEFPPGEARKHYREVD